MKKYYSLTVAEKEADIVIFGDITSWPWLESDVSSYNLQHEINGLDVGRINVHINSFGGEVAEALAITNTLLRHPAEVVTYVDGFACSAATIVFMAGSRRIMSPLSNFLVHPAWIYTSGNAEDLRKEADNLDTITEQSINAYMKGVKKSREELIQLMNEERYLNPEETLEWGFATEIDTEILNDNPTQSVRRKMSELLTGPTSREKKPDEDHKQEPPDIESIVDGVAEALLYKMEERRKERSYESKEPKAAIERPGEHQEKETQAEEDILSRFLNSFK